MIDVLLMEYWSRAEAFLLPLTKLKKDDRYNPHVYLYWGDYSIENYQLVLVYDKKENLDVYCKSIVFPILDSSGYLLENYDTDSQSIFILDISEWAMDIEMLLKRRYSKLSRAAKRLIENFHRVGDMIAIEIYSTIYPLVKQAILGNECALNYIHKHYDIPMEILDGEVGSIIIRDKETLKIENGST